MIESTQGDVFYYHTFVSLIQTIQVLKRCTNCIADSKHWVEPTGIWVL